MTAGVGPDPRRSWPAVVVTTAVPMLPLLFVMVLGSAAVLIREDLVVSDTAIGLAVGLFFGSSALVSMVGVQMASRLGPIAVMQLSMMALAVAMLGVALVSRDWWTILPFVVLAGCTNGLVQPAVNQYVAETVVPERQGVAFAVKQCAMPIAGLLAGVGVSVMAVSSGWRSVFLAAGIVTAALCLLLRSGLPGLVSAGRPAVHGAMPPRRVLVRMAVLGGLGSLVGGATTAFFVQSSVSNGVTVERAALLLALGSGFGVVVRLGLGRLVDRSSVRPWSIIVWQFVFWTVGLATLGVVTSEALILVSALLCLGVGWGWPALFHLTMARSYAAALGRTTGVAMIGVYIGGVSGPLIFSALLNVSSYASAWLALSLFAAVAAVVAVRMRVQG